MVIYIQIQIKYLLGVMKVQLTYTLMLVGGAVPKDLEFDFDHPAIKSIGSSSKALGLGANRIGVSL